MKEIKANKAGLVVEFLVQPGETIMVHQDVVMLESMKMYIPVQSSAAGLVTRVRVKEGDVVNDGDILLEVDEEVSLPQSQEESA
jgi:acetyl-CoA carboxylase biotin carboxyl carrier protein